MKLLIAGSRNLKISKAGLEYLNKFSQDNIVTELICGMAPGIDTAAKEWAIKRQIPVKEYYANWAKHGKKAGPLRNQQMIDDMEKSDTAMFFSGQNGTADCYRRAVKAGVKVIDFRDREDFVE